MGLRLAIGSGKCADYEHSPDLAVRDLCQTLRIRLTALAALPEEQLRALPVGTHEFVQLAGRTATFSTYRDPTEAGDELVVAQAFLPSWRHARFFGTIGIGLMIAEGLMLLPSGVVAAKDEVLWAYR